MIFLPIFILHVQIFQFFSSSIEHAVLRTETLPRMVSFSSTDKISNKIYNIMHFALTIKQCVTFLKLLFLKTLFPFLQFC